jgi:hypothetical protein
LSKPDHLIASDARALLQHVPGLLFDGSFHLVEPGSVRGDKAVMHLIRGQERFKNPINESDVAADTHLVKIIHQLGAEKRAGCDRGHPIAFQAVFAHGIDDDDTRALLLGEMHVLGRYRMIIGQVGAEDDKHLGTDEIRKRAGGRANTQSGFQTRNGGGMTEARAQIHIVSAEYARQLLKDIVDFVSQPT